MYLISVLCTHCFFILASPFINKTNFNYKNTFPPLITIPNSYIYIQQTRIPCSTLSISFFVCQTAARKMEFEFPGMSWQVTLLHLKDGPWQDTSYFSREAWRPSIYYPSIIPPPASYPERIASSHPEEVFSGSLSLKKEGGWQPRR